MENGAPEAQRIVPLCSCIGIHKIIVDSVNSGKHGILALIFLGIMPGFYFERPHQRHYTKRIKSSVEIHFGRMV
jgi:hypothetical protein